VSEEERPQVVAETLARIGDGVVAVDSELRYTYCNEAAADLLGVDREAVLGSDLWEPLPPSVRSTSEPHVDRAMATGEPQSFRIEVPEANYSVRAYPDANGLTLLLLEVTDDVAYEQHLGRLHEATRRMLLAETREDIAELVSVAAVRILDLPVNAVHFFDAEREALLPVSMSPDCRAILGEPPALDSGLAWDAYQSGTPTVCDDLSTAEGLFNDETELESELLLPLGDHGVFIVASTESGTFSPADLALAKLLAANATVALDQVESETRIARQRDNLELLTRMMSHDIRNDLQVVGALAEILGETLEGPEGEYVDKIRRNTAAAVELTTSAQELTEAMLRTDAAGQAVPLGDILRTEIRELGETYPDATLTVDGDIPSVTVRADKMLDSVFRNILKNAIQHNDADHPEVTLSVTVDDDTVTVSIADNGAGIPDERKEDIFGRGERGMESEGTGIGLYLVQTLIEQYGGAVRVDDNDPHGAVFVVELDRA
jgi:signal transduction histidine kinase